jgi:membrane-associated phospholipid phosphatase
MDRRTRSLLLMAAGCAALFVLVLAAAYLWDPGRSLDLAGLTGFVSADDGWRETLATWLVQLGDPPAVALMALGLAGLAAVRGRPRLALAVLLLVVLASVSSQLLKELLAHPREQAPGLESRLGPEAFPSGHATAAMSLALAAVLAAPRRARPAAAMLGAMLALAVGASVVAGGWHFPSDVVGGYLLATGWALGLVAMLGEADRRFPATDRWAATAVGRAFDRTAADGLAVAALGGAAGAALVAIVRLAADPGGVTGFARDHTTSVAVAAGVASAALALPAALAALLGWRDEGPPGRDTARPKLLG